MEDNFDKIFANKIKELTNNIEVPYNPAHWDQLLAAKKDKRKKRVFFYWRVAAVLLIGLFVGGLGTFFYKNSVIENNPSIIFDKVNDSLRNDSIKQQHQQFITEAPVHSISTVEPIKNNTNRSIINKQIQKSIQQYAIDFRKNSASETIKTIEKQHSSVIINNLPESIENDFVVKADISEKDSVSNKVIPLKNKELNLEADKQELFVYNEDKGENKDSVNSKSSIKIGLDLSPVFNYNQISQNSSVGFSGGVLMSFPVTSKFDINAGVYYANQRMDINSSEPQYDYMADAINATSSRQTVSKEAVVTGIEFPINVKYNFKVNKNDFFIAAGVTSTSYITESIEADYIVNTRTTSKVNNVAGGTNLQYELVQTNESVVIPSNSGGFNFANNLNFSVGIELPINEKRQSVIIAPYFKYALKPVTEQNVDFSTVGVHLRYNLTLGKKKK